MTRAWTADPGLEVDSVMRKGKNDDGQDTFFVQAGAGRAAALDRRFPGEARSAVRLRRARHRQRRSRLLHARAARAWLADFVAERGGGLLVLGGRSFAQRGLSGTPLEEVLPVELNDRRGGLVRTSRDTGAMAAHNKLTVTAEGETHPVMRIGATPEETRKLWSALPALAASAPLGGPRPGATVLAVTTAPGGGVFPVVAVQRYGQGRSMVFAGEASWRWRMMVASTDRTYEFFWRQAARWLSSAAPDPVAITLPDAPEPGDAISRRRRGARRRVRAGARRDGRGDADGAGRRDARRSSCATPIPQAAASRRRSRPTSPASIASTPRRGAGRPRSARPTAGCTSAARSRVRRPAAERRVPAPHRARLRRPVRPRRRGRAACRRGSRRPCRRTPRPSAATSGTSRGRSRSSSLLLSAEWILRRRWGLR